MTGFEPLTSGIGSDRSTNWATQPLPKVQWLLQSGHLRQQRIQIKTQFLQFLTNIFMYQKLIIQ